MYSIEGQIGGKNHNGRNAFAYKLINTDRTTGIFAAPVNKGNPLVDAATI
jgi:hypothetical protein